MKTAFVIAGIMAILAIVSSVERTEICRSTGEVYCKSYWMGFIIDSNSLTPALTKHVAVRRDADWVTASTAWPGFKFFPYKKRTDSLVGSGMVFPLMELDIKIRLGEVRTANIDSEVQRITKGNK